MLEDIDDVRTSTPVTSVRRIKSNGGKVQVAVTDDSGKEETFDYVIMATHGDETLTILGDEATLEEYQALKNVKFTQNRAILHCDDKVYLTYLPMYSTSVINRH